MYIYILYIIICVSMYIYDATHMYIHTYTYIYVYIFLESQLAAKSGPSFENLRHRRAIMAGKNSQSSSFLYVSLTRSSLLRECHNCSTEFVKQQYNITHRSRGEQEWQAKMLGTELYSQVTYEVATISRLLKIMVSFAESRLFLRALLQKRPIILRSLLIVAAP